MADTKSDNAVEQLQNVVAQAPGRILKRRPDAIERSQSVKRSGAADFDEFVNGLQFSMARAQTRIAESQQGQLERLRQVDQAGRTELLEWTFVLDVDGGESGETRTLRLPLASMRSFFSPQVTEFSIELPVTVEEQKPVPPETEGRITLVVHKRQKFLRRRLHKLKVRLFGRQPGVAEIEIDGQLLKTLPAKGDEIDDGVERTPPGQR